MVNFTNTTFNIDNNNYPANQTISNKTYITNQKEKLLSGLQSDFPSTFGRKTYK